MKLNFCCACGAREHLHQHHLVPVSISGIERTEVMDDDVETITLCAKHHAIIHGLSTDGWLNHSKLVRDGLRKAKQKGLTLGRPSKLTDFQKLQVVELKNVGESISEIARFYQVSRATILSIIYEIEGRP